jgi:hypothetical protein
MGVCLSLGLVRWAAEDHGAESQMRAERRPLASPAQGYLLQAEANLIVIRRHSGSCWAGGHLTVTKSTTFDRSPRRLADTLSIQTRPGVHINLP